MSPSSIYVRIKSLLRVLSATALRAVFFFSGPLGGEISPPKFQISPQNNNTFNPVDTKLHIGMAQKRLTVYFSKASSSGTTQQAQCTVSDSEAQDSLECTLCTKTHCDSDSDSSSQSGSQSSSNSESESDDPAPPPLKVPKVVSRGSKSTTMDRYHTGKRGDME